jgi:biotin operon repressor
MEIKELVIMNLAAAGKPLKPGEIASAIGASDKEVSKAIDALKKEGKVVSPKRCFYSLP